MSKKKSNTVLTDSDIAIVPNEPEFPTDAEPQPVEGEKNDASLKIVNGFVFGKAAAPAKGGRKSLLVYPVGELAADTDEYFDVPATDEQAKAVASSIRTYSYRHGFTVKLRDVPGAIRVWRKSAKPKNN